MNLKQKISTLDSNVFTDKLSKQIEAQIDLHMLIGYKLCAANSTVKANTKDFYNRAASLLRYLLHNPKGKKHILKYYSRIKKSGSVRPPRRYKASSFATGWILKKMNEQELISTCSKGMYTAKKGRAMIESCLD